MSNHLQQEEIDYLAARLELLSRHSWKPNPYIAIFACSLGLTLGIFATVASYRIFSLLQNECQSLDTHSKPEALSCPLSPKSFPYIDD